MATLVSTLLSTTSAYHIHDASALSSLTKVGSDLYAVGGVTGALSDVYRSTNDGSSWTSVSAATYQATGAVPFGSGLATIGQDSAGNIHQMAFVSSLPPGTFTAESIYTSNNNPSTTQSLAIRSTGSEPVWVGYGANQSVMGSPYTQVAYRRRTGTNTWSAETRISAGGSTNYSRPIAVAVGDRVHLMWFNDPATAMYNRVLTTSNTLTSETAKAAYTFRMSNPAIVGTTVYMLYRPTGTGIGLMSFEGASDSISHTTSTIANVPAAAIGISLAMAYDSTSDTLIALWDYQKDIYMSTKTGTGSWTTPAVIINESTSTSDTWDITGAYVHTKSNGSKVLGILAYYNPSASTTNTLRYYEETLSAPTAPTSAPTVTAATEAVTVTTPATLEGGATSYNIYRGGTLVASGQGVSTAYSDTGAAVTSTQTYTVRGVNAFGTSTDGPASSAVAANPGVPTLAHWVSGQTQATAASGQAGYMELHLGVKSYDYTVQMWRSPTGAGTWSLVHTSDTITAGTEYAAPDETAEIFISGNWYDWKAQITVSSPTSRSGAEATLLSSQGVLGHRVLDSVYTQGAAYEMVGGLVGQHFYAGQGKNAADTNLNWWERRDLYLNTDATSNDATTAMTAPASYLGGSRYASVTCDSKVWLIGPGGTNAVWSYDPSGNSWSQSANNLPAATTYAATVIGTTIYAVGANSTLQKWQPSVGGSWTALAAPFDVPTWLTAVNGILYCYFGAYDAMRSYNPATDTWSTTDLASPPAYMNNDVSSTPVGVDDHERIYLWGGYDGAGTAVTDYSADLYHYDINTDTWSLNLNGAGQITRGSRALAVWVPHFQAILTAGLRWHDGSVFADSDAVLMRPVPPVTVVGGTVALSGSGTLSLTPGEVTQGPSVTLSGSGTLSPVSTSYRLTWTAETNAPASVKYAVSESVNGLIYVIGGSTGSTRLSSTWSYNHTTNTWDSTTLTAMPTARERACSVVLDGKIWVMGGATSTTTNTAVVEVYDPATDTWDTSKASLPHACNSSTAQVIGGKIYVAGGTTWIAGVQTRTFHSHLWVYDPGTNTWDTSKASMGLARYGPTSAVLNGKLHVAFGYQTDGGDSMDPSSKHEVYDHNTDTWSEIASPAGFGYPVSGHSNDRWYIYSGYNPSPGLDVTAGDGGSRLVQVWDDDAQTWGLGTAMLSGKDRAHAASGSNLLAGDVLYIVGGQDIDTSAEVNWVETATFGSGVVSLSGSGALTFSGTPATSGSLEVSGEGTLQLTPVSNYSGSLTLSGDGTLQATVAALALTQSTALAGDGTLTLVGTPAVAESTALAGEGTLSFTSAASYTGILGLAGEGTLTLAGVATPTQTLPLTGEGALELTGVVVGSLDLSGSGSMGIGGAGAPVSFVGVSSGQSTASTNSTASLPSGVQVGDLMIAYVAHTASSATLTTPATGWTLLDNPQPADFSTRAYYRVYQSGDTQPSWTWSASGGTSCDIAAYRNVAGTPINASSATVAGGGNALAGSVTPTVDNTLVVGYAVVDVSTGTRSWTTSGAMTERLDNFSSPWSRVLADEQLSGGSGAAVSRTFTITDTAQDIAVFMVALAPQAGGDPKPSFVQTQELSGTGTFTGAGDGTVAHSGSVDLSGAGTLAFTATVAVSGEATQAGSGSLSGDGVPGIAGAAETSGSGTLLVDGVPGLGNVGELAGGGSLSLNGVPATGSDAALSGAGTLTLDGSPTTSDSLGLSGDGTLTLTGAVISGGSLTTSGDGTLSTGSTVPTLTQSSGLTGSGTLTLSAIITVSGSTALSGDGSIAPAFAPGHQQNGPLAGEGTLALFSGNDYAGTVVLAGDGLLVGSGRNLDRNLDLSHTVATSAWADTDPSSAYTNTTAENAWVDTRPNKGDWTSTRPDNEWQGGKPASSWTTTPPAL